MKERKDYGDAFYLSLLEGRTVKEGTPLEARCLQAAKRYVENRIKEIDKKLNEYYSLLHHQY